MLPWFMSLRIFLGGAICTQLLKQVEKQLKVEAPEILSL